MTTMTTVHPVDERLPTGRLTTLGLQHVLVMYAGAVAVPLIIGRALKLSPEQVTMLIQADLFCWYFTAQHLVWYLFTPIFLPKNYPLQHRLWLSK